MKTDFKVYQRKIHVYCKGAPKTAPHLKQFYVWSTNAYKSCREAVAAARVAYPDQEFTATFAKD